MTHDIDIRPQCFGSYGSFHGEPVKCSPVAGCGLKGCPWQRQIESKPTETVYAHVERTVHALCDAITRSLPAAISSSDEGVTPEGIKMLAEAVQALAAWPQFNPMNAHEQYKQLAEYEVDRAMKAKLDSLQRDLMTKHAEIERNLSR